VTELDSTVVPDQACPRCGYKFDRASPAMPNTAATPSPGDISLCLDCGQILVFNDDARTTHAATSAELADLDFETRATIRKGQRAIAIVKRRPRA
jgi:hypothetical protein